MFLKTCSGIQNKGPWCWRSS